VVLAGCGSDGPSSSPIPGAGTAATVVASTVPPAGSGETVAGSAAPITEGVGDGTGADTAATATAAGNPEAPTAIGPTTAGDATAAPTTVVDATVATTVGTEPAWAEGFGRATVTMEGRPLRVAVASTEAQRHEGLRQVSSLAPFDGMLFVFEKSGRVSFTMADTLIPLSIGFYDDLGQPVGQLEMFPCQGSDSNCPSYDVGTAFRYALETELDRLPTGPIQI
jgi:uncharacterized membrane protein (UPF0127 family)